MFSLKKYLPIFAAFAVGIVGAATYAVHAQTTTPNAAPSNTAVVANQNIGDGDGETADDTANTQVQSDAQDPNHLDGETNDDTKAAVNASTQEAESGPGDTGSDVGEVDQGN